MKRAQNFEDDIRSGFKSSNSILKKSSEEIKSAIEAYQTAMLKKRLKQTNDAEDPVKIAAKKESEALLAGVNKLAALLTADLKRKTNGGNIV